MDQEDVQEIDPEVVIIWKPVEGYPNYEVSNYGAVRNVKFGRVLLPSVAGNYDHVTIYRDGESKTINVHRLVALAFVPCIEGCGHVNHINSNKRDNYFCNLEWTTPKRNSEHAVLSGSIPSGENNYNSRFRNSEVADIRSMEGKFSQREIARALGVSQSTVWRVLRRRVYARAG